MCIISLSGSMSLRPRRKFNRDRLPTPAQYYSKQFPNLVKKSEWVNVCCCFHEDSNPSLSLHLVSGRFKCHACHAKGFDILSFHRQLYGMTFVEAVTSLGGWENE